MVFENIMLRRRVRNAVILASPWCFSRKTLCVNAWEDTGSAPN